jgi:hypothetical protein
VAADQLRHPACAARRTLAWSLCSLALCFAGIGTAQARPFRVSQIPNGAVNGCANCHVNPAGGGTRNAFGTTIELSFLSTPGPTGNVLWGSALAALDSDFDGVSNGSELQDPAGSWVIGQPAPGSAALVTLPGTLLFARVPALPPLALVLLGGSLLGAGWRARRKSRAASDVIVQR